MSVAWNGLNRTPLARRKGLEPGQGPQRRTALRPVRPQRKPPGGFTDTVELQIRTRAGHGDPAQALCEAHGDFLGEHAGEFQHIVARGMGGSRDPVKNSAANGTLICPEAHRLAETRADVMRQLGFWLPQGTDPRAEPMVLYGLSGGMAAVWRPETGPAYLYQPPGEAAA